MTIINKLVMHGFKSFAKRTEIPFLNGFNIIVGGNGAGKSNIADSLCFVLGKSSAKEMRAEKSAHLIFNGGKKGSPAKEAKVEIYFDNSNNHFPIDAKELKVSRIVRQNGLSKYKINDETRTRQQVLELLNAGKIDPDGHNIVLQGDIIGFTEMKNEDRRKIIEEISGISIYEERKEKAMSELEKVHAKLAEANIILTEREAYLRELKSDRDKALKYRGVEDEIKSIKATIINLHLKEKEEGKFKIESELNKLNNELTSVNQRISEIKKLIDDKKEEIKRISTELDQKGEIEQKKLQIEIERAKIENVKLTNRKEVCENEINKIKDRKESLEKNLKDIDLKINELNKNKNELLKKQNNLINNEKKLLENIQKFKEKHKLTDAENLESLENEVDLKQKNLEELQLKRHEIQRESAPLEFELGNVDDRIKKSSQDSNSKIKDLRNEFKKYTLELSKFMNENSAISAQLARYRRESMEKDQELAKLKIRDLSIKEFIGEDLATKRILGLKENGVYGTVSSLGNVSSKYAQALDVAGGPRIKSIVVESDQLAAKCINMLKEQKLGVVTFLPLNKLRPRIEKSGFKEMLKNKDVIGLAVDLVNYDKKFESVFSYVFGDTVIVNDVETARRIGIGRTRMVTLEGDLMEVSGSMTGGFRRKTGLGFKEREVSEDLERLEVEVSRLRSLVDELDTKKLESEDKIYTLRQKKAELEAEIIKLEKLEGLEDVEKLKERRNEINEQLNNIISRLRDNENLITSLNKEINKSKELRHNLRERTKDIHLNEELEKLELDRQKTREEILAVDAETKNINLQVNNMLMQEKERTLKIIKDHEKEREDFTSEIKSMVERIQQLKLGLKDNENKASQFYSDYRKLFNLRNKINEEIQQKETGIARDEERTKGINYRINNSSIDKAKVISEIEGLNKEAEEFADAKLKRGLSMDELKNEAKKLEVDLKDFGNVNLRALEIYEKVAEEYKRLVEKSDKLKLEKDDVLNMITEIDGKKKDIFMKTYNVIDENFKRIFSSLSNKGEAHLELEDPETVFNAGLDIKVRLNSTKFLDIKSLSGGEKSLTALAFIFAIQEHQPASFYLLDEVDAALDRRNSELLSKLIKKYSENAQYIVVSHNDAVVADADQIYGVSMQEEISKVVSLKV